MDKPHIVRMPTAPPSAKPDIHELRAELAGHLKKHPVESWPPSVLAAVSGVLTGYTLWRESVLEEGEVTRPLLQLLP